jgi:hypothetical protein
MQSLFVDMVVLFALILTNPGNDVYLKSLLPVTWPPGIAGQGLVTDQNQEEETVFLLFFWSNYLK